MGYKYIMLFIISLASGAGMVFLPEISLLCMMALAVSVALLTIKKGFQAGIIALVIAVGVNFAIGLSVFETVFCFASAISGLLLGIGLLKGYSLQNLLIVSAGSLLMSILLGVLYVNFILGKDVISGILDAYFKGIKDIYTNILQNPNMARSGIIPSDISVDEFRETIFVLIDEYSKTVRMILPSIFIAASGLLTYFNLGLVRFILAKTGTRFVHIPTFPYLKMSRGSGWVMIVVWVLPFFFENEMLKMAFLNVSIVIMCLFMICAISFIDFKLRDKVKSAWLRALIYIGGCVPSLILFDIITTLLMMLGMADSILDFRSAHVRIKRG